MAEFYIESITINAQKAFDSAEEAQEYLKATGTAGDLWFHWACKGHKHLVALHSVQESLVFSSEVSNILRHLGAASTLIGPEVTP